MVTLDKMYLMGNFEITVKFLAQVSNTKIFLIFCMGEDCPVPSPPLHLTLATTLFIHKFKYFYHNGCSGDITLLIFHGKFGLPNHYRILSWLNNVNGKKTTGACWSYMYERTVRNYGNIEWVCVDLS